MVARKFRYIILFLVSSCATANSADTLTIDNQLSQCISIADTKVDTEGKIPVLSFHLQIDKHIAECGCKSALGSYTVFSQREEYTSFIIGGKVGFSKTEEKYLPLAADQKLIDKRKIVVRFSCAQPD